MVGLWANLNKKPVILDPVGVGASTFRKEVVEGDYGIRWILSDLNSYIYSLTELLNTWQASVIKGNAGELATLAQSKEVPKHLYSFTAV
jgi:thiamine-phosphate diphosphorylase / hydroxyethylthiazole kinase